MSRPATVAIEEAFTEEWGRIVAVLIARTRDWDLAEECAQQAFAEAASRGRATASRVVPARG